MTLETSDERFPLSVFEVLNTTVHPCSDDKRFTAIVNVKRTLLELQTDVHKKTALKVISKWNPIYAPQMNYQEQGKELFRQEFETPIRIVKEEKLIIGADMDARVGKRIDGYEEVHGGYVIGIIKEDREYTFRDGSEF
ncbi:uncharacterized protein [Palaemon carinicauda]|uniref:uncharacterized protein n=1 Tax=Palaemon carinicauda TaxID=392227 RepID=UPI0035B6802B